MFFPDRGGFAHLIGYLAWAGFMLIAFLITAVVLVLLVRFLWFGTKAARLYIASHTPAATTPVSAATPPESVETDVPGPVTPDASGPVAPPVAPRSATKPRKPKSSQD